MRYYTKITCFENKRRLQFLYSFRELVSSYFDNLHRGEHAWMAGGPIEKEPAKKARVQINRVLHKAHAIIKQSGMDPSVTSYPAPAIGGYVTHLNVIVNIFDLHNYQISEEVVFDNIDRSIGVYKTNSRVSFFRTINPFYWIGLILDYIVQLPFSLLRNAGFDTKKIEDSNIGRIIKALLYLIPVLAAFLKILEAFGYLENFKKLFKLQ